MSKCSNTYTIIMNLPESKSSPVPLKGVQTDGLNIDMETENGGQVRTAANLQTLWSTWMQKERRTGIQHG